jgi:hypothetical protein
VDLTSLRWIKVVTDDDVTEWAYTRERLKKMENVIDKNEVTIFPLGFRDDTSYNPEINSLIALIQKGKLTHIVKVLDNSPYKTEDWFHRIVRVIWWKPIMKWENLPPQSELLGFDPTLMDGKPHLLTNLKRYDERWETAGGLDGFKDFLIKSLEKLSGE